MIKRPRVALIAEVGHRVGWGHVSRCMTLRRILFQECDVVVKIVNREPWEDSSLEREFAFQGGVSADVVFVDGLELLNELKDVHAGSIVSLSYMSDANVLADLVVVPALNGMGVPGNYVTSLEAILCNLPATRTTSVLATGQARRIGISMGGADVEGLTPILRESLAGMGYEILTVENASARHLTLSQFLSDKLTGREVDDFPYYSFSGCDLVVCQGGLSAIEIALLGIPTVIRSRSDFMPAYRFLETSGCAQRFGGTDIDELVRKIMAVCGDADLRTGMIRACSQFSERIRENFWMKLVHKLIS